MPKQITDLEIDEVSLVAKGANQHAKVTIAKSAKGNDTMAELFDQDGSPVDEDSLQHGQIVFSDEGEPFVYEEEGEEPIDVDQLALELGMDDADDYAEVGKSGFFGDKKSPKYSAGRATLGTVSGPIHSAFAGRKGKKLAATGTSLVGSYGGSAAGAAGGAAIGGALSRGSRAGTLGGMAVGNVAGNAAGQYGAFRHNNAMKRYKTQKSAGGGVSKSYAEEIREELSKSLTDKDRDDVISKALGRLEESDMIAKSALEAANQERELRLHSEYTEIAKSYNLPVEDEALGEALMHCAESLSDQDCEVIAKCLGAAGEVLFQEYGAVGGGDNEDVFSMVAKSVGQDELSSEQMLEVLTANPELYDQYLSDQSL